jgi:hypothetical protein
MGRLAVDPDIIHVMLILQTCKMKEYRVIKASTQISKESLGGQIMCDRVRDPAGSPRREMCESLRSNGDPRKLEMPGMWSIY